MPQGTGPALRRRGDLHDHPAGPGLLPRTLRLPLPVRHLRPGVRARVQHRGHGEPGPGHLPRGVRLPRPDHARRLPGPGQHAAARDGAHVVRRPGHHGVVGRPVAEGVLRRLHGRVLAGGGDPLRRGLDRVRQPPQGVGLPGRPAALHAPRHGRHPRPPGRQAQLRRHHLRQGRLRAQAAGRLRGPGRLPRRGAPLLQAARLRQHAARRPARGAHGDLGPGHARLVPGLAGDHRRQRADAAAHLRGGRAPHRAHRAPGGARRAPDAAPAPRGRRALRGGGAGRPDRAVRPRRGGRVRAEHAGSRAGRSAGADVRPGQRRRSDVLQDAFRRGLAGRAAGGPGGRRRPAGPRPVLVRAVEPDPGRPAARQ